MITGENTRIQAGLKQIFAGTGTFAGTWNVDIVNVEWFGAIADYSGDKTDNYNAFQNSIDFALLAFANVSLGSGYYYFTTGLVISEKVIMYGEGYYKTVLYFEEAGGTAIQITTGVQLRDFYLISTLGKTSATYEIGIKGRTSASNREELISGLYVDGFSKYGIAISDSFNIYSIILLLFGDKFILLCYIVINIQVPINTIYF